MNSAAYIRLKLNFWYNRESLLTKTNESSNETTGSLDDPKFYIAGGISSSSSSGFSCAAGDSDSLGSRASASITRTSSLSG